MWFEYSTDLEDGIVEDILRRLPVKSLARFKSVSKLWNYAISHPNFLQTQISVLFTTHYVVQPVNHRHVFNVYDRRYKRRLLHFVENQSPLRSLSLSRDKEPWKSSYGGYFFVPDTYFITNSCHGLVVIGIKDSLYLFNPSTDFLIKVLELDLLDFGHSIMRTLTVSGGFCYDNSTNDYKVVLTLHSDKRGEDGVGSELVLVASLKLKSWSLVERVGFHLWSVDMGPIVNGKLHCIAHPNNLDRIKGAKTIYHFDPRSEIFEELLIPPPRRNEDDIFSLGVLNDQLVMCRIGEMGIKEERSIEVMVMKKYGVLESWTTLFVISNVDLMQDIYYGSFALFAKNGEVYIVAGCAMLVAYNPITETYRNVEFQSNSYDGYKTDAAVCLDVSLVQPKGLEWDSSKHEKLSKYTKKGMNQDRSQMFRDVTRLDAITAILCVESSMTISAIVDTIGNAFHSNFAEYPDQEYVKQQKLITS